MSEISQVDVVFATLTRLMSEISQVDVLFATLTRLMSEISQVGDRGQCALLCASQGFGTVERCADGAQTLSPPCRPVVFPGASRRARKIRFGRPIAPSSEQAKRLRGWRSPRETIAVSDVSAAGLIPSPQSASLRRPNQDNRGQLRWVRGSDPPRLTAATSEGAGRTVSDCSDRVGGTSHHQERVLAWPAPHVDLGWRRGVGPSRRHGVRGGRSRSARATGNRSPLRPRQLGPAEDRGTLPRLGCGVRVPRCVGVLGSPGPKPWGAVA